MRVRGLLAVAVVMSLCRVSFCSETNNCVSSRLQFSATPMHLRAELRPELSQVEEPVAGKTALSASLGTNQFESTLSDGDFHSHVFRTDRFYLTQSKTLPEGGVARFIDTVFTPEVAHVGKVSVSSPILTIAKRKNPLCLLSAFGTDRGLLTFNFLELSW
jgi:hypothetical protein